MGLVVVQHVQDCQDPALVAHTAALRGRVPILHFHDEFRTSHEINTIQVLDAETMRGLVDHDAVREHRGRRVTLLKPIIGAGQLMLAMCKR